MLLLGLLVLTTVFSTFRLRGDTDLALSAITRNFLTFVNTIAIAQGQDPGKKAEFWPYAIAVVFTNVRTLRVYDNPEGLELFRIEKNPGGTRVWPTISWEV